MWRIAGTGGEVQHLSGDRQHRGVILNWLGVTGGAFQPVACVVAPSARGQEDGYYPYCHHGAVELRPPGRQAFPGTRSSCEGPDAKAGLIDLETASVHIQQASEDLEESLA